MSLPVILVSSSSGSDTQASGAGPATALFGTTDASTDGAGTTVTLTAGTDLTGVLTDGSAVLYLADTTAGARNFGKITNSAGSGGATPTVVVANAFGLNLTTKSWAIGGKRASFSSTTSAKLFSNNSAAGDAMPGWAVEMQSGHVEPTIAAQFTVRRSGDQTDGYITLRGTSGAATPAIVTFSNNGNGFGSAGSVTFLEFRDFEIQNTNATKTASIAISLTSGSLQISIRGMRIKDSTNKFWKGITNNGGAASSLSIVRNWIANCALHGIESTQTISRSFIRGNRIENCGGSGISFGGGSSAFGFTIKGNEILGNTADGITYVSTTGASTGIIIDGNTIRSNGSDGIDITQIPGSVTTYSGMQITNNILANNTGNGLNLSGAAMTAIAWNAAATLNEGNQTFGNAAACNLSGVLVGDSGLDPQFPSSTDLEVGVNMKGVGFPTDNNPGQTYRSYETPGANEAGTGTGAVGPMNGLIVT